MGKRLLWLALALRLASPAGAVDVTIDYTYDTRGFFGAGNPDGAAAGARARAAIEAAAGVLSDAVDDSLIAIQTPQEFTSAAFDGAISWDWSINFSDPSTGGNRTLENPTIGPDEFRVYVGGRPLTGAAIGFGGPGGWGWSSDYNGGGFASSEINQVNAISLSFQTAIETRGEPEGEFAGWGGAVTFDTTSSVNWHWDHTSDPARDQTDFYSVALHELFHVFGFGVSEQWNALASGGVFSGDAAREANGGTRPPVVGGHWREGLQSTVYGGTARQETLLDPTLLRGTRQLATTLDFAALDDIGWTILDPGVAGDFNNDGLVNQVDFDRWRIAFGGPEGGAANGNGDGRWDAADYTLWRDALVAARAVPEPGAATGLVLFGAVLLMQRRGDETGRRLPFGRLTARDA